MPARHNPAKPFIFLLVFVVLSQICKAGIGINHGYVLYSSETMFKYDTLKYGNYTLEFQTDCRLVLSDTGKQIWTSSNRAFDQRCKCMFLIDGNLTIFGFGGLYLLWKTIQNNLNPEGYYVLVLQKDRNLVIYGPDLWHAGTEAVNQMHATNLVADASSNERYVLYDGETINSGESLKNGRFSLVMQEDCDLVLYDGETPVWSTKTAGKDNNCICKLKSNGNLIVYKTWDLRPYWSAMKGRSGHNEGHNEGHYVLVLQDDGNVLYDKLIWSSGTNIVKAMVQLMNSLKSFDIGDNKWKLKC